MNRISVLLCVGIAVLLAAVIPDGSRGQFGRDPAGYVQFDNGRDLRGLPFELNSDKMYLRTTINGRGPFWLVLDTGSPGMIIDTRVVNELGLKTGESWRAGGAGDKPFIMSEVLDSVDVELAGLRLFGQNAVSGPIDSVVGPFEGRTIDGVLGCFNLFAYYIVEVDFHTGLINVLPRDDYTPPDGAKILPVAVEGGHAHFEATLTPQTGEPVTGQYILDTGLRGTGILTSPFVKNNGLEERMGHTELATTGGGVGGEVRSLIGRSSKIQFGDVTLDNLYFAMYQGTAGILADEELAGIVGSAILQRYRCVFDYPGERILFYDNTHDSDRLDYDKSGMFLVSDVADRSIISVIDVVEGSPGDEAGIKKGDVIPGVDGTPAKTLRLEGIRRLFRRPAGTTLRLDIKRDGVYSKSRLTLRRII